MMKLPEECVTMSDIRQEIDRIDRDLMTLLRTRFDYIGQAAIIKKEAGLPADIPPRVMEVRENARRNAAELGLDPDFYEGLWAQLIAQAIAHEDALLSEAS